MRGGGGKNVIREDPSTVYGAHLVISVDHDIKLISINLCSSKSVNDFTCAKYSKFHYNKINIYILCFYSILFLWVHYISYVLKMKSYAFRV